MHRTSVESSTGSLATVIESPHRNRRINARNTVQSYQSSIYRRSNVFIIRLTRIFFAEHPKKPQRQSVRSKEDSKRAWQNFITCVTYLFVLGNQCTDYGFRTPNNAWKLNRSALHYSRYLPDDRQRYKESRYK